MSFILTHLSFPGIHSCQEEERHSNAYDMESEFLIFCIPLLTSQGIMSPERAMIVPTPFSVVFYHLVQSLEGEMYLISSC